LDVHNLALTQGNSILDEPYGRLTEHDTARRCHGFHPLGHAHLSTDRGVPEVAGADLAGDHLTGIQADAYPQIDPVSASDLNSHLPSNLLNLQSREARTKCMALQRDWRAEERHNPVTGELVHGAAIALHHSHRLTDQLGHHLTQPLRTKRRGDIH